jgi:hypothetical protein
MILASTLVDGTRYFVPAGGQFGTGQQECAYRSQRYQPLAVMPMSTVPLRRPKHAAAGQ